MRISLWEWSIEVVTIKLLSNNYGFDKYGHHVVAFFNLNFIKRQLNRSVMAYAMPFMMKGAVWSHWHQNMLCDCATLSAYYCHSKLSFVSQKAGTSCEPRASSLTEFNIEWPFLSPWCYCFVWRWNGPNSEANLGTLKIVEPPFRSPWCYCLMWRWDGPDMEANLATLKMDET